MDRRGDPCRSDGSLAHSGLASHGFRPTAWHRDLWFARSRVPFLAEGAVDALLMPATVSSTGQGARCRNPLPATADVADNRPWMHPGAGRSHERWIPERSGSRRSVRTAQPGHRQRGVDGIRRPARGRSDSRVRRCGTIHRLRDTASEWPIRVRVTTANAGCVSTRDLNHDRRRPRVKAVSARTPTGSLDSLPPLERLRKPRRLTVACSPVRWRRREHAACFGRAPA